MKCLADMAFVSRFRLCWRAAALCVLWGVTWGMPSVLLAGDGVLPVTLMEVWRLDQSLQHPESVVFDVSREVLYVSSINGDSTAKDANGYISKIDTDGRVLDAHWVSGLNGPKGLALHDDKLYCADIDQLVVINTVDGKIMERYPAAGAVFLNDVAVDSRGRVYVSDSGNSIVYRLADGKLENWLDDKRVRNANGLYAGSDGLVVAAGNADQSADPGKDRYLQLVDYDSKEIRPLHGVEPLGSIDAVERDALGGYFLTDWPAGKIMYVDAAGAVYALMTLEQGTADLDYVAERNMVYLPLMMNNALVAYRVNRK